MLILEDNWFKQIKFRDHLDDHNATKKKPESKQVEWLAQCTSKMISEEIALECPSLGQWALSFIDL